MEKPTIGYIGLGVMGRPAAINLIKAGFQVHVWARRGASATQPLTDGGAVAADSLAALAERCDVIITNVSDTPDVEGLLMSDDGIGAHLQKGQLVIDMSTISPSSALAISSHLADKGVDFLDAPVSGGEKGAIEGTLTFMVGGTRAAFDRAAPVFQAMGKTITRIGDSGAGQVAKMCNQVIIGATVQAVAESFALARKKGVDLNLIREALSGGFAASRVLDVHAKRMIDGDYVPGFRAILHRKDIGIALTEAAADDISLQTADIFLRSLDSLAADGGEDLDSSAIYKIVAD